ncbi:uncharacterized protein LOC134909710 isoform X1 [Pseudophryne corroboree]|uniref:uncharacterized protein LOC134909710 isoform X1 n=1 Tax=Pseudophryne corroboree TaxID=495146 RepID=UPI00308173EF
MLVPGGGRGREGELAVAARGLCRSLARRPRRRHRPGVRRRVEVGRAHGVRARPRSLRAAPAAHVCAQLMHRPSILTPRMPESGRGRGHSRGVQRLPLVGNAEPRGMAPRDGATAESTRGGRAQHARARTGSRATRGGTRAGTQWVSVTPHTTPAEVGRSGSRGRRGDREWVSGRRAAARAAAHDSGSSPGPGDSSASMGRGEACSEVESEWSGRGGLAFPSDQEGPGARVTSAGRRARARAQARSGGPSGAVDGGRSTRDPPGALASALATVVEALGPLAAAASPRTMSDFGQAAGGSGSGRQRTSAAQRVARACRELGAVAAELGTDQERQGRALTGHTTRGARRAPQAWAGPSSALSFTESREEGDLAEFVEDDDWTEEAEDSRSERSMASGELAQSISISPTSSSSHSSSSSSSSSSLSSQASDVDSTSRAKKKAAKFAKRAAKQQKRRKRRKRVSEEERRAKKRRDLPGVVRCEYTAVMRGLRDSCRKKIRRGDFVDLFVLTKAMKKDYKAAAAKKGMGTEVFRSFDNWLAGFWVFTACYLEDRPEEHMNVIRYLHLVHDMQRTSPGSEWRRYDQEFREKQDGLRVMDFGFKDVEVWLKVTRASQQEEEPQKQGAGGRRAGSSAQGSGADGGFARTGGLAVRVGGRSATRGKCFAFNSGTCSFGKQCRFRHSCQQCGGAHPASSCFKGGRQGNRGKQAYPKQAASGTARQSPNAS